MNSEQSSCINSQRLTLIKQDPQWPATFRTLERKLLAAHCAPASCQESLQALRADRPGELAALLFLTWQDCVWLMQGTWGQKFYPQGPHSRSTFNSRVKPGARHPPISTAPLFGKRDLGLPPSCPSSEAYFGQGDMKRFCFILAGRAHGGGQA